MFLKGFLGLKKTMYVQFLQLGTQQRSKYVLKWNCGTEQKQK